MHRNAENACRNGMCKRAFTHRENSHSFWDRALKFLNFFLNFFTKILWVQKFWLFPKNFQTSKIELFRNSRIQKVRKFLSNAGPSIESKRCTLEQSIELIDLCRPYNCSENMSTLSEIFVSTSLISTLTTPWKKSTYGKYKVSKDIDFWF